MWGPVSPWTSARPLVSRTGSWVLWWVVLDPGPSGGQILVLGLLGSQGVPTAAAGLLVCEGVLLYSWLLGLGCPRADANQLVDEVIFWD